MMKILLLLLLHTGIHELGHVLMALCVGSKVKRVWFNHFGPYVQRTPAKTPLRNAVVALAGPGVNLITFCLMFYYKVSFSWIPLYIGVFNLLPFSQSDLSKAVRYLKSVQKMDE
jgi:hypothetical protein